jgi:hypothetical protein
MANWSASWPPVRCLPATASIGQAGVSIGVAWQFTQQMIPNDVPAERFPLLAAYSAAAESRPEFRAAPHGDGTYRAGG